MNTADFNALDWSVIVIVGASTLFGFRAGLVRVVIGFAAGLVGLFLAFWFYQTPAAWFSNYFHSTTITSALGFLTIFGGVVLAGGMVARLLGAIFKWAGVTWLDRLLGAGVGFLRGVMIAVGIVTPLLAFAVDPVPKFLKESQLAPYTVALGRVIVAIAPTPIRVQFESRAESLKFLWKGELRKVLPGVVTPDVPKQAPVPLKKESF